MQNSYFMNFVERNVNVKIKLEFLIFPLIENDLQQGLTFAKLTLQIFCQYIVHDEVRM